MTTTAKKSESKSALDGKLAEKILACVREEELVSMACDVINIPSPTGEELQMAQYMRAALQQLGLNVTWQEIEEGRALFKSRVTPEIYELNIYDRAIVDVMIKSKGHVKSKIW